MKRCYLFFIGLIPGTLLFLATARAGTTDLPLSVRQMSMGFTVSNRQAEPLLIFANPSALCQTRRWTLSSFYSHPYGLKEINLAAAAFTVRLGNWTTTLAGASCGFELFREQQLTIGIGAPLFQAFQLGIGLRYQEISIKKYGHTSALAIDVGWQYGISERARILGSIQNLNRATIGQEHQSLPQTLRMGLQLNPLANLIVTSEIYKDLLFPSEARFGLEMQVIEGLQLRCGFTRNPARFTGGLGIFTFGLSLDYAFSYHNVLGYTHAAGITLSH